MKKLFLALVMLTCLANMAFAATCNPNTDKLTIGGVCITTNGTFIPDNSGGTQVVYEEFNTSSVTTTNALTATESGKFITDMGGVSGPTLTGSCAKHILPRAAVGLTYTITAGSKCTVTVDTVDTSDTILYSISGTGLDAGDSIKSTGQAGDSVTVTSTAPNRWTISQMKATWTDNGTN